MSTLQGKSVVLIGDSSANASRLVTVLKEQGVVVREFACDSVSATAIFSSKPDLIVMFDAHHVGSGTAPCAHLLQTLKNSTFETYAPVIVAVPDDPQAIETALLHGATDYFTPDEHPNRILQKIKLIFGIPDNFSGSSDIDISSRDVDVSDGSIKVLVIEDDPLLRNLLSIRLARSKFPFEFCGDGEQALTIAQQFMPDIIILDLMLPGKSGFEVLDDIKANPTLASIPVIVFSNRDSHDDKQRAKQSGAVAFYIKATTDLSELIEHMLKFVHKS